jgi:hypothetical protein
MLMRMILLTTGPFGLAALVAIVSVSWSPAPVNQGLDPEVLSVREAAWRAYFAGDVKALGELLPSEFIGISMNEGPFTGLDQTMAGAVAFARGGGRLVRLDFPETQAQRFGDVVVLYGRYEAVVHSEGTERTLRGRLTEIFVRRGGKWWHPGWHLDLTAAPVPPRP